MSIAVRLRLLSLGGLEKLSHNTDASVLSAVTQKLLQRIGGGISLAEARRILGGFDGRTVTGAVIEALYDKHPCRAISDLIVDHPNTGRALLLRLIAQLGPDDAALSAFRRIDKITFEEIERLTIGRLHPSIAAMIAQHSQVSRMALINILRQGGLDGSTYRNAFGRLSAGLTYSEVRYISITAAPEVMALLLGHNRLTPEMAAEVIANRIQRNEEAVRQMGDGREITEIKYGEKDIHRAVDLMQIASRFNFIELLGVMEKVNPELAAGIRQLISRQ